MTPIWHDKLALHCAEQYTYTLPPSNSQPLLLGSQGLQLIMDSCWFCHSRKVHNQCTAVPPGSWGLTLRSHSVRLFPQHYSSHVLSVVFWRYCHKSVAALLSWGSLPVRLSHFLSLTSAFPQLVFLLALLSLSPLWLHFISLIIYFLNQSPTARDDLKMVFPSHGKYWYTVFIRKSKPSTHQTSKYLCAMSYVLQQYFSSGLFRSQTVHTHI